MTITTQSASVNAVWQTDGDRRSNDDRAAGSRYPTTKDLVVRGIVIPPAHPFRMGRQRAERPHPATMQAIRRIPLSALLAGALFAPSAWAQKSNDPAAEAFFAGPAWNALLAATDGGWHVDWNPATGTPRALYGRGLPIAGGRIHSLAEARRHADVLLRERGELLGLGRSDFREAIGTRMGRTWSFVYDQYFRGLPCIGGRADVRVSMAGRIAMFGSTAWRLDDAFVTVPTLTPEAARLAALQALLATRDLPVDARRTVGEPRLVIWGDVHTSQRQTPVLAYEVAGNGIGADGTGPVGRYYVDAHTGAVLHFANDQHQCGVHCHHDGGEPAPARALPTVPTNAPAALPSAFAATAEASLASPLPAPIPTTITVLGAVRTNIDVQAAPTMVPLPGLEVPVAGHGVFVTDENGTFTVDLQYAAITQFTPLNGIHHAPTSGANQPAGLYQLTPGVDGSVQISYLGAPDAETAHLNASWWTHRANTFARSVLGDTPQLDVADGVQIQVNNSGFCDAFYNGSALLFRGGGGGCANMAQSTVIAHEWGHGLDDRYGGISQNYGLGEGWADLFAMYLVDDPHVGKGLYGPGTYTRIGTNTRQYPASASVHEQGESWMGFGWKLRERLAQTRGRPTAIAVSNEIVLGSIVANATTQPAAVLEVWLADDNDGDLTNGTPHAAELAFAADQHALPDPAPAGVANDECSFPFQLQNGANGPFGNVGATTSLPTWTCGQGANDVWFSFAVGAVGTLDLSTCGTATFDTVIEVFQGACGNLQSIGCNDDACPNYASQLTVPVTPGLYLVRVGGYGGATGSFSLNVTGPSGAYGTTLTFGSGCDQSRSFFELFSPATFDLSGTSLRMALVGDRYVVQPGGSFVPPPATATDLGLGDEDNAALNLPVPFPVPGGSSNSLVVYANGYVATGISGLSYNVLLASWLNAQQRCWGAFYDFDPSAAGSGGIKRHDTAGTTYLTWDGVFGYQMNVPNTFQIQLDHATGDVTLAFQTATLGNYPAIVGSVAGGGSNALGRRDLSAAVPATFTTGNAEVAAPTLTSSLPHLGQTVTLTTTFDAGTPFGLQLLGLQALNPGVPLDALGFTGCQLHTSAEVMVPLLPAAGSATYLLPVPVDGALMGLVLGAQSVGVVPTAGSFGLGLSRGVQLTIGV